MAFDPNRFAHPIPGSPIAVAEIGTAHGGDRQRGLDLVDAAADAGADVAKIQVVFAEEILPPEAGLVPLPGGDTPLFEVFRNLERPADFYAALAERAAKRGLGFLASPFGERSIRLLEEIGTAAWKVASPELNHEPLLERLAATGRPIILSTGVSTVDDIRRALKVVREAAPNPADPSRPALTLLHCLTSYPAPEAEANLRVIPVLAGEFGRPVGLSDHSLDPVLLPGLASALGAVMVEKHITLDREAGGLDDPVALTPEDFARMVAAMRRFAPAGAVEGEPGREAPGRRRSDRRMGNSRGLLRRETDPRAPEGSSDSPALRAAVEELAGEYGRDRVEAALGDGVKRLAPSENPHYRRTNRSLHAVGPLAAGTVVGEVNTALLRTEKVLRPGLPPHRRREAYGRRLVRDVAAGDGIDWDDLEPVG